VLQYDPRQAVLSQTIGVIASSVGILFTGWLGDRVPPRYLLRTGVGLLLVFAYPFYAALESRAINLTLLCTLAGLAAGLTNGSFAVLLTDLFPTRVRFTGVALVFNVSFTIFSGTAPLVATSLIGETGRATSPAYMMILSAVLALAGSLWVERLGGNVLRRTAA
jgi:MFS family permease